MNIWSTLGIEYTNDVKIVKKAYAKLIKIYHPEEYPEEFKKINEAYKLAINLCKGNPIIINTNDLLNTEEELTQDKFKNIEIRGNTLIIEYGVIEDPDSGNNGCTIKFFETNEKCEKEANKQITQTLKKDFIEQT